MRISDDLKDQIKGVNDIVDVIGETVRLEQRGNVFIGLCPFEHGPGGRDVNPSLTVYPDNQSYYCYGCGAGDKRSVHGGSSDVIGWIQNLHNVSFVDACQILAERSGISWIETPVDMASAGLINETTERNRRYYTELQGRPEVLEYLRSRHLNDKSISLGRLGMVPDDDPRPEIRGRLAIGIPGVTSNGKKPQTVSMAFRTLKDEKPKYLNDHNNAVFQKGHSLYLLPHAIKAIRTRKAAVLVEGYFDALLLHQFDVQNTVASMGTSLTETQTKLLRRYTRKVYLWMDSDSPGVAATIRALPLLFAEGIAVQVISVLQKDPAEIVPLLGDTAWDYIQKTGQDGFIWFMNQVVRDYDEAALMARLHAYEQAISVLETVSDPVRREVYGAQLKKRLEISF